MAKYHLTKKAVQDLDSIWAYTLKTWSEKKADEIHTGLYRRSGHKHLVFYRLVENGDVEIVRILHERMDIVSK